MHYTAGLPQLSGAMNAAVVFGALHSSAATLGAAYLESGVDLISLSGDTITEVVWFQGAQLEGSALRYLRGTPYEALADQLFAYDIMPPGLCGGSNGSVSGSGNGGGSGGGGSSSSDDSPFCVEFNGTTVLGDNFVLAERVYSVDGPGCVGPELADLVPTQSVVFDLEGRTRDPCEGQFGAFGCSLATDRQGRESYALVYRVGCDSACGAGSCVQEIPVEGTPGIDGLTTCLTTDDAATGEAVSMRASCDPDTGAFAFREWAGAACEGACLYTTARRAGPENLCFDASATQTCNVTTPADWYRDCAGAEEGAEQEQREGAAWQRSSPPPSDGRHLQTALRAVRQALRQHTAARAAGTHRRAHGRLWA